MAGQCERDLFLDDGPAGDAIAVNARCLIRTRDGFRLVLVVGAPIAQYAVGDAMAEGHAMVSLVEQGWASQREVARAFGCAPRTVRRCQRRFEEGGLVALGRPRGYPPPTIVEVIVKAPLAAKKFRPGQFYRLQNYEAHSAVVDGTRLATEGMALTGAWTDPARGLLSLIVLEMGGSSRLCAYLQPGEPVIVMGPTGTPTEIPSGETVVLACGGLTNAWLTRLLEKLPAPELPGPRDEADTCVVAT